jgi:hypothetical protein
LAESARQDDDEKDGTVEEQQIHPAKDARWRGVPRFARNDSPPKKTIKSKALRRLMPEGELDSTGIEGAALVETATRAIG